MKKSEIIKKVAEKCGEPESYVDRIISRFLDEIRMTLRDGKPVVLYGFGRFESRTVPGRTVFGGLELEPKRRVYFRMGSGLRGMKLRRRAS